MKKIITLMILLCILYVGYSQSVRYGVEAGLQYNSLIIDQYIEDQESQYKAGLAFNAIVEYMHSDRFGLRMMPGFTSKGAAFEHPELPDAKLNLNYLTVPVVVRYSPVNKLSLLAGPEIAFRLTAKSVSDGFKTNVEGLYDSKTDFGIYAGVSYNVFDKIHIGLKYNRGFISTIKDLIFTDEFGQEQGKAKLYNQGFVFSLAYLFLP